ncbi:hypothetical protein ACVBEG_27655 [Pseudomonas sp. GG8]
MNKPSRALSVLIITLIACACAGLTITLQHATSARIIAAREAAQAQRDPQFDSSPPDSFDNHPLQHPLTLPEQTPATQTVIAAYLATLADQPSAILFHSRTQGYSGTIELIGVSTTCKSIGVKALKQNKHPVSVPVSPPTGSARQVLSASHEPASTTNASKKKQATNSSIRSRGRRLPLKRRLSAIHETLQSSTSSSATPVAIHR